MWARILNMAFGIWMMAAPYAWDYSKPAANNAYITGALIAAVAIISMSESVRAVRHLNKLTGAWLIVAPWVLASYSFTWVLNDTLTGLALIILSAVKGKIKERFGGGWQAILRPPV